MRNDLLRLVKQASREILQDFWGQCGKEICFISKVVLLVAMPLCLSALLTSFAPLAMIPLGFFALEVWKRVRIKMELLKAGYRV